MYKILKFLKNLDRRIIYLIIFLSIILPFLPGFEFLKVSFSVKPETKGVYATIADMEEGDAVFFDWSFDPSVKAELLPFAKAFVKQCFRKKVKLFIYYSLAASAGLGQETIKEITELPEFADIEEGKDYLQLNWLGYGIGPDFYILNMSSDFKGTFKKEGKIFEGLNTLHDIDYFVCAAGNAFPQIYIDFQLRYRYKLGIAVTAVSGPDFLPYIQTGQLNGMVTGLRGAAEYEKMLFNEYGNKYDKGTAYAGMASLTLSHLAMIFFILLGNFIYVFEKKRRIK
ncbi:MAG: hypothetical protein CR982_08460 [Candidatus Cloacimonadota bacterium]|nr:MAG: hypothetical protein CR982_08460 [Candidatus Cloacimonadota bacterium]PIE77888.1 MAG: hypothetical protein CSA15_10600 [Candidatus Delongbacteria bacterium]